PDTRSDRPYRTSRRASSAYWRAYLGCRGNFTYNILPDVPAAGGTPVVGTPGRPPPRRQPAWFVDYGLTVAAKMSRLYGAGCDTPVQVSSAKPLVEAMPL